MMTGTPIASVAATMPARTPGSVNGSTAVEFSGHTTKSGRGVSPAATSSASSSVRRTWLAVTSRCTAGTLSPVPGTSPCTAATVTVPASSSGTCSTRGATVTASVATAAPATARGAVRTRRTAHASSVPLSATSRLAPVIPTHGIAAAHGVSAVAYASRPNGMPEKGKPLRQVSTPTHHSAAHRGHQRSRMLQDRPIPNGTKKAASMAFMAIQASVPTARIHSITVKQKATPKTSDGSHARVGGRPRTVRTSTATAGGISQARPTGSNAAASASPPTRAARQRIGTLRP